ncbi:hypothetical protein [Luteococcus sp. OSA5]
MIDTAHHAEPDSCCWPESEATIIDDEYVVHPWSVVVLIEYPQG